MKRFLTLFTVFGLPVMFTIGCANPFAGDDTPVDADDGTDLTTPAYIPCGGPGVTPFDTIDDDNNVVDAVSVRLRAPDGDVEELMVFNVVPGVGTDNPVCYDMRTSTAVPLSCLQVSPGRHPATADCPPYECIAISEHDCRDGTTRPTAATPSPVSIASNRRLAVEAHKEARRAHERIDGHHGKPGEVKRILVRQLPAQPAAPAPAASEPAPAEPQTNAPEGEQAAEPAPQQAAPQGAEERTEDGPPAPPPASEVGVLEDIDDPPDETRRERRRRERVEG